MERKVGEIFEVEGVKLQVVEDSGCVACYFLNSDQCVLLKCSAFDREDKKSVKFKK